MPLIKLSYRPPNYETPISYFNSLFMPNDAFFFRYHLANIPEVDAATWRLKIGGEAAEKPFELTLDQLKSEFPAVEIAAVCQCSSNRRGLFPAHVPGVQWGYGAITFDRFHAMKMIGYAADEVRRNDVKARPELKGTRYVWTKNASNLSAKQGTMLDALATTNLKTARLI